MYITAIDYSSSPSVFNKCSAGVLSKGEGIGRVGGEDYSVYVDSGLTLLPPHSPKSLLYSLRTTASAIFGRERVDLYILCLYLGSCLTGRWFTVRIYDAVTATTTTTTTTTTTFYTTVLFLIFFSFFFSSSSSSSFSISSPSSSVFLFVLFLLLKPSYSQQQISVLLSSRGRRQTVTFSPIPLLLYVQSAVTK